jgi:hypothetical protein
LCDLPCRRDPRVGLRIFSPVDVFVDFMPVQCQRFGWGAESEQ